MWHIGSQVTELKKLVYTNKDILEALRTNFDKPDVMKELAKKLVDVDSVLQRMTIVGVILCFKELIDEVSLKLILARKFKLRFDVSF